MEYKIIGENLTYNEAKELKIPKGYRLATINDYVKIINMKDHRLEYSVYYGFKQILNKNIEKYPLSVAFLGGFVLDSFVSLVDGFISVSGRLRGVIIVKKVK
jgi:hypothetical protein